MNRHLRGSWLLTLVIGLGTSGVLAQPAPTIPPAAPTAANVQPYLDGIGQFIDYHVQQLIEGDAAAQTASREALTGAALERGNIQPGPAYLDAYSRALNASLVKMPEDAPIRARLNAAIVASRVAAAADNYRLADAAVRFMNDPAMPVVLWGLKVAEHVLPQELNNPLNLSDPKVLNAISKAVEAMPAGAIVDEAYEALRLRILERPSSVQPPMVAAVVPVIHGMLDHRIQTMTEDTLDLPSAETRATFFLTNARVWPMQNAEQKLRTVQLINNLINVAVQRAAENPDEVRSLVPAIQDAGKSIQVVGQNEDNKQIQDAATAVSQITENMNGEEMIQRAQALQQALQAAPTFSQLEPAPQLQPSTGGQAGSTGAVAGSTPQ